MTEINCSNTECEFCKKRKKDKIYHCEAEEINIGADALCCTATEITEGLDSIAEDE